MRLGFDLDNVIISYPPLIPSWLLNQLYKEPDHGKLQYRIPGFWEQRGRSLLHFPLLRQAIPHNLVFLRSLKREGKDDLYLISSRFGFLKRQTNRLIKRYQLDKIFRELFFNFNDEQPHLFKDAIVKHLRIERYIDDDLPLLTYLADNNPEVNFFWYNPTLNKTLSKNLFATTHIESISNQL